MTGDDHGDRPTDSPDAGETGTTTGRRARATIRTAHADPETVAAALAPDNTDEMDTRVDDGDDEGADARRVHTEIERTTAAELRSTADDYLVNLDVADRTIAHATDHTTRP